MNRKLLILSTALISGFTVTSAHAGFEWNAAPKSAAPSASQSISPSDAGGPLTPMPGETMTTARVEPVMASDIMDNGTPVAPVTQTNMAGMKSIGTESDLMLPVPGQGASAAASIVDGFGKDIPLATALHQVVPANYAIAFDGGVDQGKPVSWKGGKAWTKVLSDMLSAKKLHAEMSGNNTVRIVKGSGPDLSLPSSSVASNAPMNDPIDWAPAPASNASMSSGRPVIDLSIQKKWNAPAGQSLRQTLQDWSSQANVELAWQDAPDMPLKSAFTYSGSYDQAVDALLSLYGGSANEPHGKLYPNLPEGPSVLVIGSN